MSVDFTIYDTLTGIPRCSGHNEVENVGAAIGESVLLGARLDLDFDYVRPNTLVVAKRPGLPVAAEKALLAGEAWAVSAIPDGTSVLVDGVALGETGQQGLQLAFELAGAYRVDLLPPLPWLPASCAVRVS